MTKSTSRILDPVQRFDGVVEPEIAVSSEAQCPYLQSLIGNRLRDG